jgi:D-glycero-D-manno-heptose 1,7-bisphosphate phosphatase
MKSAVFLDRDDTLIRNLPYLGDPSRVELMPRVHEGLALLAAEGLPLFVISNQSGVGRGLITREQVGLVNEAMEALLSGIAISGYYMCYDAPGSAQGADERKPSPVMLQRAAEQYGLDLSKSVMLGDRLSDVQCGKNAGCASLLVLGHSGEDDLVEARAQADFVAEDFFQAAQWVVNRLKASL